MNITLIILVILFALFFISAMLYIIFPIIQVSGDSMIPTFRDGQYLLSCRFFRLKEGRIYVFRTPIANKIVIKRLTKIKGDMCFFVGDNRTSSYDSRSYGYVHKEKIISVIIGGNSNEFQSKK